MRYVLWFILRLRLLFPYPNSNTDVATQRPSRLLVPWRKPGSMPYLFQIPGSADQGYRSGLSVPGTGSSPAEIVE